MKVNEIFLSIQGEGLYAGVPMVFIRLQGCTLYCLYCDTVYSQDSRGGANYSSNDILGVVEALGSIVKPMVCITGGEPLEQEEELYHLVNILHSKGYEIEIETNGCMKKPRWWEKVDFWVPDMKCPSSGKDTWAREKEWYTDMRECDQVKFVVGTLEDLQYTRQLILRNGFASPQVLISPVLAQHSLLDKEQEWLQEVVRFVLDMRDYSNKVRLSLQIHKFLWPRTKRGV